MSCKLITHRVEGGQDRVIAEREFDQKRITIGRGEANDLVLKDPGRVVSTKHAELHAREGAWVLLDVGSTNGTRLNGVRVTPRQEYSLRDGDHLGLGPYEVVYHAWQAQSFPEIEQYAPPPAPVSHLPVSGESQELLYLLRRLSAEGDWSSQEEIQAALGARLRRHVAGYEAQKARELIQCVKAAAQQASGAGHSPLLPPGSAHPSFVPEKLPGHESAQPSSARRQSEDRHLAIEPVGDAAALDAHVARVLQAVFSGLADAIRGRREFQKEFEVEATRILAWTPNAIKQAESTADIQTIVLHPESQGLTREQVIANLEEVFQDLTLHQLGLLAGFRECVRGLLKELDPQAIAKSGKGGSSGVRIGLLGGKSVKADAAAWKQYVEKHRQLTEEEVKVFERILAPHFATGYLSIHKSRHRPS